MRIKSFLKQREINILTKVRSENNIVAELSRILHLINANHFASVEHVCI